MTIQRFKARLSIETIDKEGMIGNPYVTSLDIKADADDVEAQLGLIRDLAKVAQSEWADLALPPALF